MLKPQVTQIGHNTATSHHFGTPGLLLSKDDDDKQLRLFASEKIEEEKSITVLVASNARREVQLVAGLEPSSERNHGGHYGTQSSPDQKKKRLLSLQFRYFTFHSLFSLVFLFAKQMSFHRDSAIAASSTVWRCGQPAPSSQPHHLLVGLTRHRTRRPSRGGLPAPDR